MKKPKSIASMTITISYKAKNRKNKIIEGNLEINGSKWIKLNPEEQESKLKETLKESGLELISHDI